MADNGWYADNYYDSAITPISTKTADYTLSLDDTVILCDCSSGMVTLTLPDTTNIAGKTYTFIKIDSTNYPVKVASSTANVCGYYSALYVCQFSESLTIVNNSINWWPK